MNRRIDGDWHAGQADKLLGEVHPHRDDDQRLAAAQVHATLALLAAAQDIADTLAEITIGDDCDDPGTGPRGPVIPPLGGDPARPRWTWRRWWR